MLDRPGYRRRSSSGRSCRRGGAPAALLDWGFPISGKALRQIATDAELTPILFAASGDPLHVGRKYRTATAKMRKALAARDLHCVWLGCDRPPVWTEKHHLDPWVGGGKTEVERMALCCKKHHPKVTAGWRLERGPGGEVIVHPPPPREPVYGPAVHEPPPGPGP